MGKDPVLQRWVAIKTLRLDLHNVDNVKEARQRFFQEVESTGRLAHPNIITVYDAGEEEGSAFLAMEYLEGKTLTTWCRREHQLPVRRAVEVGCLVADALDYAHEHGVVHRDIKPGNIMVTKDNTIKVMDFGVARLTTSTRTQTTMLLGTPSYMSPEQVAGEAVDGRSDVFSLGIVLFELLTGEKPFEGENLSSILFKIAHQRHPSLLRLQPDLPPALDTILDHALEKDVVVATGQQESSPRTCVPC